MAETKPTPSPATRRPSERAATVVMEIWRATPVAKMAQPTRMVLRRPMRSARTPEMRAPQNCWSAQSGHGRGRTYSADAEDADDDALLPGYKVVLAVGGGTVGESELLHGEDRGNIPRVVTEQSAGKGGKGTHEICLGGHGGFDAGNVDGGDGHVAPVVEIGGGGGGEGGRVGGGGGGGGEAGDAVAVEGVATHDGGEEDEEGEGRRGEERGGEGETREEREKERRGEREGAAGEKSISRVTPIDAPRSLMCETGAPIPERRSDRGAIEESTKEGAIEGRKERVIEKEGRKCQARPCNPAGEQSEQIRAEGESVGGRRRSAWGTPSSHPPAPGRYLLRRETEGVPET